jgi:DNA topoisomerase-3
LLSDKYLQRDGRELFPTQKGIELIGTLEAMQIHDLCSPELTGEWEHRLTLIEKGQLDRPTFMEAIRGMTRRMIDQIKTFDPELSKKPASFGEIHGMPYFEYPGHFESADGKVRVRKVLGGRTMTPDEIGKLLREGQLGPLEGFVSKRGKPFAALLEFKENKVEFNFGDEADLEQYIQGEPVCHSFIDQSPVYETPTGFLTKSAIEGDAKGLKINRVMLGKDIGRENALRLMKGEKTELITGFRSSKTKRLFDAFLELDPKGKIKFSFPDTPRPRRGKAPASQADATES